MDAGNARGLLMDSLKLKLRKDFEVPNFKYFILDYGLKVLRIFKYRLFIIERKTIRFMW